MEGGMLKRRISTRRVGLLALPAGVCGMIAVAAIVFPLSHELYEIVIDCLQTVCIRLIERSLQK